MRIAIMGTRGVPPAYGGFETLAWELSTRLLDRGHEVTVYCRRGRTDESVAVPPAIRRRFLPYVSGKYMETVTHTALSAVDAVRRRYDVIWLGNAANALVSGLPRIRGTVVVLNVDGIERQRAKWGVAGRLWYRSGERLALVLPNEIVSDAHVIEEYYRTRYGRATTLITYGAPLLERDPPPDLARHGLHRVVPGRFFLYVSRLEPENQADVVIDAYRDVPGDLPLLVVGDAPYAPGYRIRLEQLAALDRRVRLTGGIYGAGYRDLQRAALAYIQATSVGGTHPALVEAMGAGNIVVAFATPENTEVAGECGLLFRDRDELTAHLAEIVADPEAPALQTLRHAARRKVERLYSWDAVTTAYEQLFERLLAGAG